MRHWLALSLAMTACSTAPSSAPSSVLVCPFVSPETGSACEGDLVCYYGEHGDCWSGGIKYEHVCQDGHWAIQTSGSCQSQPPPSCPSKPPELGKYCDGSLKCYYDERAQCVEGETILYGYLCVDGRWILHEQGTCEVSPCPDSVPAEGDSCVGPLYCDYSETMDCAGGSTIRYLRACFDSAWTGVWEGQCQTVCPTDVVEEGAVCLGTLSCYLGGCSSNLQQWFTCDQGAWTMEQRGYCQEDGCPPAPPTVGDSCDAPMSCDYKEVMDCVGALATRYRYFCSEGVWTGAWTEDCQTECPQDPPEDGDACVPDGLDCAYGEQLDCSDGATSEIHHACTEGTWASQDSCGEQP